MLTNGQMIARTQATILAASGVGSLDDDFDAREVLAVLDAVRFAVLTVTTEDGDPGNLFTTMANADAQEEEYEDQIEELQNDIYELKNDRS